MLLWEPESLEIQECYSSSPACKYKHRDKGVGHGHTLHVVLSHEPSLSGSQRSIHQQTSFTATLLLAIDIKHVSLSSISSSSSSSAKGGLGGASNRSCGGGKGGGGGAPVENVDRND